jgi:hypothetical protein
MELSWIVTEEQNANANTAESASVMTISMTHTVMLRVFLLYQILFFSGRTGCLTLLIKTPYNEKLTILYGLTLVFRLVIPFIFSFEYKTSKQDQVHNDEKYDEQNQR